MPDRIIRAKTRFARQWMYVACDGVLVSDPAQAEKMDNEEADRRIERFQRDYPGWVFETRSEHER